MSNWKPIVGQNFQPNTFAAYCQSLNWTNWRPSFIVLHNTAVPTLAQRPNGLSHQNILDLEAFYRDTQHWSAGPHLFVDDKQIWVFTPLTTPGVHSPSWNHVALGIEMLGNYDTEDFGSGRGLAVRENTVAAIRILCGTLGLNPLATHWHKVDPLTTHKGCPGKNVVKEDVLQEVISELKADHGFDHPYPL